MTTDISTATNPLIAPSRDEIAQSAHERWLEAGQPEGRDDEFWLEAEHRLLVAQQAPNVSAVIFATLAQPVTRMNIPKNTTPDNVRRKR